MPRFIFRALARGLAVDPDERYASLEALVDALTLREATLVSSAPGRRRWLLAAARALALAALGFALGGSLAALRARLRHTAARTASTVAAGNEMQPGSPNSKAAIERAAEQRSE